MEEKYSQSDFNIIRLQYNGLAKDYGRKIARQKIEQKYGVII